MPALKFGITGGLGSGKSTVLTMFKKRGAVTMSADALAHRCLEPGQPAYRKAVKHFGREILGAHKKINRGKLGKIVFENTRERRLLERWIHPAVKSEIRKRMKAIPASKIAAVEVPLLFENGFQNLFDSKIVVWCDERTQKRRLTQRNGWTIPELNRRLKSQWPLERKRRLADLVVDNSKNKAVTSKQVEKIWKDSIASPGGK